MANPFDEFVEKPVNEDINPFAKFVEEPDKVSQEIDMEKIRAERENPTTKDEDLLQTILDQAGPNLIVNGQPVNLENGLADESVNASSLLNFLLSGDQIRTDITSRGEALVESAATGLTNLIGLPADLSNMASRGLETLGRKGLNALFGTELSTDPQDYLFSNDNPIGGGQSVRDAGEALTNATVTPLVRAGADKINENFGTDIEIADIRYLDDPRAELPPELRGYGIAGQIAGENVLPIAAALKTAKAGFALTNTYLNSIRANPTKFALSEAGATAGQAGFAVVADSAGLENPYATMGAEILGSLLGSSPVKSATLTPRLVVAGYKKVIKPIASKLRTSYSKKGVEDAAFQSFLTAADTARTNILQEAAEATAAGDTLKAANLTAVADQYLPSTMFENLETGLARQEELTAGLGNLPAGTLSNNAALLSIQRRMMGESTQFSSELMERANNSIAVLLELSEALARGGNPAAAATLRTRAFSEAVDATLATATDNAQAAMSSLDGADAGAASILGQKTLFQAKDNMRQMESFLWDRIDGTQSVDATDISRTVDRIKNSKLMEGLTIGGAGEVNSVLENFIARINNGEAIPVSDVLKFRRIMLAEGRKAAGADDLFNASIFDEIASASADSLGKLPGESGDIVSMAREFSLQLNKRFTRYFPQDVLSKEGTGGTTIREQDVMETGFAGGGDRANTNFAEMRTAANDADRFADGLDAARSQELDDAYAEWLADRATKVEQRVNDIVMPQEIAGPPSILPSTVVGGRTTKIRPEDVPLKGEDALSKLADDLAEFARQMDAEGNVDMAEMARKRLAALNTRGPLGEQFFDPTDQTGFKSAKLDETFSDPKVDEGQKPETEYGSSSGDSEADDFKLNEGGDTQSVARIEPDVPVSLGQQMGEAQEEFLRAKVLELRNATPLQGGVEAISSEVLEKFVADNPKLIEQFPNLRSDIQVMFEAQRTAEDLISRLGKAGSTDRLPEAIGDALATNNPAEAYAGLANEATGIQALEEFKNATLDNIFLGAIKPDGKPDMVQIAKRLFSPVNNTTGGETILDLMQKNGVLSTEEVEAMSELVFEGLRIEKTIANPAVFDEVLSKTPDIANNIARILGANAGVIFGRGQASLQAAQIGSNFFKKQIDGLPLSFEREEAMKLLKLPRLLVRMLKGTPDARVANQTAREFLIQAKDLSFGQLVKRGALVVGDAVISSVPLSTISAVSQRAEVEEALPTVTVDQQMRQALPQ